ncbi:MAG TPA: hypothetical protein VLQ93_15990 [Myxococcaceae bacterium]|nr:hypothetical protein [Myxococcaceae bacterium]
MTRKGRLLVTLVLLGLGGCVWEDEFGDPSVRTPLPVELTDREWRDPLQFGGAQRVLEIYDPGSGSWLSNDESDARAGSGFRFYEDGRYVRASYVTVSNGGCVTRAWAYQQGSVSFDAKTLTLYPAVHRQKYEGGCNSASDMDQDGSFEPQSYAAGIQTENDGYTYLYLQTSDTTLKYVRL